MMTRFKFKLEAVEKVRRIKEQEALRSLSLAQAKFQAALRAKQSILESIERALVRREALSQVLQPVLAYQLENDCISGNRQRAAQADQAIFRARKGVEKALREVISAKRALRVIELLREKAFLEFKTSLRKREQKQMEEIYASLRPLSEDLDWSDIA